ncbi:MAG TPA: TolC family protein [Terriglobales bacterium]|nr:TolC family protein [Terriglobales bacterium]
MRKKALLPVFLIVLFWFFSASAQELQKRVLTVDDAVNIALKHSFPALSAQQNYQSAKWNYLGGFSNFLPSLSASSGWTRNSTEVLRLRLGQLVSSRDQYSFNLGLDQTIFNGGANFAGFNLKRYGKKSAWDDLKLAEQSVTLNVKQGCYDLLKAQMLYDVQVDAVGVSLEQLKMAKARYDLGAASLSDYLKAKVQLGNDSLTLITNENNVKLAEANLNNLLGLDVNTPLEINAKLEYTGFSYDVEQETRRALDSHPQIDKARMGLNQSRSSLTVARSANYPSISFFGDYSWSDIIFPKSSSDWSKFDSWDIGLRISLSIFDGFLTTGNVRSAKAQVKLNQDNLEQNKRTVALAIKQAYVAVKEAEQKIQLTNDALTSAEEDLKLTQEKYNLGAASILDLLDANVSYKTAKNNQVQALYDYNLAVAQFEQATGR